MCILEIQKHCYKAVVWPDMLKKSLYFYDAHVDIDMWATRKDKRNTHMREHLW